MKALAALCVLLCCFLTDTHFRGDRLSENAITQEDPSGESESRENNEVNCAEYRTASSASTDHQTCQPDIHTVLREMSALIAEQRVELRYTKTQVDALEARLVASERTVQEQRAVIEELREKQEEQAAALRAVEGSVNVTGCQVEELRREREQRRVSFSAALVASSSENDNVVTGPSGDPPTLVYRHVFTNIGNAYNPNTGIFTAPVKGVYHFVVFVFGDGPKANAVYLFKNSEHLVLAYAYQSSSYLASPSNGVSVLLEVGDVVYAKLYPNTWVRDNGNHHNTFSGHLLFPL